MEVIKLTNKMLNMSAEDLLIKLGAVNIDKKVAYPQHVYFSKEDYKELRKNLRKYVRDAFGRSVSNRLVTYSVNMSLLNYGPNETLKEAVRPGWALIDRDAILEMNK